MNQILYTGGKNKKGGMPETNKIVIFFIIFIIIFAICLIAVGANLLGKVKSPTGNTTTPPTANTPANNTNTTPEIPVESDINITFESQVGGVKLSIESLQEIEEVSYWWDEETATKVEVGEKEYKTVITSKQGTHTLKVEVTDVEGYKEEVSQLVIGDAGPEVSISTDGVSNYVVKAKDDERVDKIVIILNGEIQEIEVNDKEIEHKIPIPQGDSLIEVTAHNLNGLTTTKKAKITNFGG